MGLCSTGEESPECETKVTLLDYGAGNVRSVVNAIEKCGHKVELVTKPEDITNAKVLVFPGVGAFGSAMEVLHAKKYVEPLRAYIKADRPFLGICIGMQALFEESEESPGVEGVGVIPGKITRFDAEGLSCPQIGWNQLKDCSPSGIWDGYNGNRFYFVHSFRAVPTEANKDWQLSATDYGGTYMSAVQKGNVIATQFHPEKSGAAGLRLMQAFLDRSQKSGEEGLTAAQPAVGATEGTTVLGKRVIACLDVRSNDKGDLVVTKGDQYDVREKSDGHEVRNLGKPVELCSRYYEEGADEVAFLNITAFRDTPLDDQPMVQVLEESSKQVFVPLTIGGGIRDYTDKNGQKVTGLQVATAYFRAGADKVSIGSDAVEAAKAFMARGNTKDGSTTIEQISAQYGRQAVVISVDPKRVYVTEPDESKHTVEAPEPGPKGEKYCWYACTVKGGREVSDLDAHTFAVCVEALGAGEILLNCIDKDGQNNGYEIPLIADLKTAVSIPVIASSGAGCPDHFVEVFEKTGADAALAAGIFHRREVPISDVKQVLKAAGVAVRV